MSVLFPLGEAYQPGREVAGFTVLAHAGCGSGGNVLLVQDVSSAIYAMKVVRGEHADDLSALTHLRTLPSYEGLVQIHSAGRLPDGAFYYLMDCADNRSEWPDYHPDTLANRLGEQGPLSASETLELGDGILRGLRILHERGLVHRDVKPENILFRNGAPILADFGLVTQENEPAPFGGTPGYMPPEIISSRKNKTHSGKADLYALGKVLYCAWTGRAPQEYPMFGSAPDKRELCALRPLYSKACAKSPAFRYHDADAFARAVAAAKRQLSHPGTPVEQPNRYRAKIITALLCGIFLPLCVYFYADFFQTQRKSPDAFPSSHEQDENAVSSCASPARNGSDPKTERPDANSDALLLFACRPVVTETAAYYDALLDYCPETEKAYRLIRTERDRLTPYFRVRELQAKLVNAPDSEKDACRRELYSYLESGEVPRGFNGVDSNPVIREFARRIRCPESLLSDDEISCLNAFSFQPYLDAVQEESRAEYLFRKSSGSDRANRETKWSEAKESLETVKRLYPREVALSVLRLDLLDNGDQMPLPKYFETLREIKAALAAWETEKAASVTP